MSQSPRHDWMEDRLRSERPEHNAPPGFTERVMEKLPSRGPSTEMRLASRLRFWPRLAFAVPALGLAVMLTTSFLQRAPNQSVSPVAETIRPAAAISFPKITVEQVQALTARIDEPLEKELESVISDTRQAIQFVASNFLPEK